MIKIGHTDGFVFSGILQQLFVEPIWGNELRLTSPSQTSEPGEKFVPLSIVPREEKVDIDPTLKQVLLAMSHVATAIGKGQAVSIEKLGVDGEVKYNIVIKNGESNG